MLDPAAAQRIAAAYPPEARHTPAWEREAYLTETQQLAWLLRFDPERAAEVLSASDAAAAQFLGAFEHSRCSHTHQGYHYG